MLRVQGFTCLQKRDGIYWITRFETVMVTLHTLCRQEEAVPIYIIVPIWGAGEPLLTNKQAYKWLNVTQCNSTVGIDLWAWVTQCLQLDNKAADHPNQCQSSQLHFSEVVKNHHIIRHQQIFAAPWNPTAYPAQNPVFWIQHHSECFLFKCKHEHFRYVEVNLKWHICQDLCLAVADILREMDVFTV